jgi:hypothetical protein
MPIFCAMALSSEEIAVAKKMRDFVRMYEGHLRSAQQWNWILGPIFILNGLLQLSHVGVWSHVMACVFFVSGAIDLLTRRSRNQHMEARYVRERAMLQVLEREHHDQLPWHHPPPLPPVREPVRLFIPS